MRKTRTLWGVILCFLGITFLFPLYWMANLSLKSKNEVFVNPFGLPQYWIFRNYIEVLENYPFFLYMTNSLIYTIGTIILTLLLGSTLAYAISRMNWKYSKFAIRYITLGLILPVQVLIIPLYTMMGKIGLRGTHLSLIIPYASFTLASCVLMLSAFLKTLPYSLEEASYLDGCSIYQTFFKIVLPIITPALVTQTVIISLNVWNEFFLAFIFAGRMSLRPLTVGLLEFFTSIGVSHWGLIGAAMIMSSIPTIILYCLGNKQIEYALSAGAILK